MITRALSSSYWATDPQEAGLIRQMKKSLQGSPSPSFQNLAQLVQTPYCHATYDVIVFQSSTFGHGLCTGWCPCSSQMAYIWSSGSPAELPEMAQPQWLCCLGGFGESLWYKLCLDQEPPYSYLDNCFIHFSEESGFVLGVERVGRVLESHISGKSQLSVNKTS